MTAAAIFEQTHILLSQAASSGGSGSSGDQPTIGGGGNSPMPPGPDEVEKAARLAELQKKFKVPITGIEEIHPSVANLSLNNQRHILSEHHAWWRLVKDPNDWDSEARIITKVMKEGVESPYKGVYRKVLEIGSEEVEVIFQKIDNAIKIGNAWVVI